MVIYCKSVLSMVYGVIGEYHELGTVNFWVIEGIASNLSSIRPCAPTRKPANQARKSVDELSQTVEPSLRAAESRTLTCRIKK
jgi:hypothetical protein